MQTRTVSVKWKELHHSAFRTEVSEESVFIFFLDWFADDVGVRRAQLVQAVRLARRPKIQRRRHRTRANPRLRVQSQTSKANTRRQNEQQMRRESFQARRPQTVQMGSSARLLHEQVALGNAERRFRAVTRLRGARCCCAAAIGRCVCTRAR